jgi:hypothetical protein
MGRLLGVFAAVLASCSAAPAADPSALALRSGNDLLAVCSHQGERGEMATSMEMACIAYIASAVDSYSVTFCPPPEGSTRGKRRTGEPSERYGRRYRRRGLVRISRQRNGNGLIPSAARLPIRRIA